MCPLCPLCPMIHSHVYSFVRSFIRLFESDSEYERLLLIQTPVSYNLNPTTPETSTWQNGMMAGVTGD